MNNPTKKIIAPAKAGGLAKASENKENISSRAKLDISSDSEGKSTKKLLAFDEMPGNNKRKKVARPEPKPEPIVEKKPEPIVIPKQPEKVKEKTIIKEEAKIVYIPKTKEIRKHEVIRKTYPKNEEYDNVYINLQDNVINTQFFKPRQINRHLGDDGRVIENILQPDSDDSFVKIEIPITIVKKDVMPERPPFVMETRISFTVPGREKLSNDFKITDDFCIEAIRVYKGEYESCDYEEDLEEIVKATDKKVLLKSHKNTDIVTRTSILEKHEIKHDLEAEKEDGLNTARRLLYDEESKLQKGVKKLLHDEINMIKFELSELQTLKDLNIDKVRLEEEKKVEAAQKGKKTWGANILPKIKELKTKLIDFKPNLEKKESLLKKILTNVVNNWKDLNKEVNPTLNDSITKEVDAKKKEEAKTSKVEKVVKGKKDVKPNVKVAEQKGIDGILKEDKKIVFNGSIKLEKTKDELNKYFKDKIQVFKNTILTKQNEFAVFENKKEYILKKELKVLIEKKYPNDKILRYYENGAIEYVLDELNYSAYKVFPDGFQLIVYDNKDVKQFHANGNIIKYFFKTKVNIFENPNDNYRVIKYFNGVLEQIFYTTQVKLISSNNCITVIDPIYGEYVEKSNS